MPFHFQREIEELTFDKTGDLILCFVIHYVHPLKPDGPNCLLMCVCRYVGFYPVTDVDLVAAVVELANHNDNTEKTLSMLRL